MALFREKKIKGSKGFTLLELLIAIFIITMGLVGTMSLIQQATVQISISSPKLIASYLAQEGIEIVRNIRDTNWLKARENESIKWDDGIAAGDWEADYNENQTLSMSYTGRFLSIDADGFYSYSGTTPTKFKRKIRIFDKTDLSNPPDGNPDILKVSVLIEWSDKGKTYQVAAQENLYDWK